MGESYINLTEGSGKKSHTWQRTVGANNVEDSLMIQGEYPYATYSALVSSITTANANQHLVQIMAGASTYTRIRRIEISQVTNAGVANVFLPSIIRLSSAGTGGTAVTAFKFDASNADPGTTVTYTTTSAGTETGATMRRLPMQLRSAVPTDGNRNPGYVWEARDDEQPIVIAPGTANGIAIKNYTSGVGTATIDIMVEWVETSFA